jgi:hypothetical protein
MRRARIVDFGRSLIRFRDIQAAAMRAERSEIGDWPLVSDPRR